MRDKIAQALYNVGREGQTTFDPDNPEWPLWEDLDPVGREWYESNADAVLGLLRQGPTVTGEPSQGGTFHQDTDNQKTYALVELPEEDG